MRETEELDPMMRSAIRAEIDRVFARFALQGRHGPIPVKAVFMEAAQALVQSGIIDRPAFLGGKGAGGQSFVQLVPGRQPEVFPDYGIPENVARLMRQRVWELYLQGVLAPGTKLNPEVDLAYPPKHLDTWLYLDDAMITPHGARVLGDLDNRIPVHDPDRYLANFLKAEPPPDPEMMRYLTESVSVFRRGHFLATVVLLGIASERLVEVFAESVRDALGEPEGTKWFDKKFSKQWLISRRFKALSDRLMEQYEQDLKREKLKEPFNCVVKPTFDRIRCARNDIAHPSGREFTWNEVSGLLHNFVQYFIYTNRIMALFRGDPHAE